MVTRLLIEVASLVSSMGSRHMGFSSHSMWLTAFSCLQHVGLWDLPGPAIEQVSLALQGAFLSTGPPGKPSKGFDKG